MNITASINTSKIDKQYLKKGKDGFLYLSISLKKDKDGGKSKYGNDGFLVQGIPKEMRREGLRGPIIGNYREYESFTRSSHDESKSNGYQPQSYNDEADSDIPF